jgi:hypothetical protein
MGRDAQPTHPTYGLGQMIQAPFLCIFLNAENTNLYPETR